MRWKYPLMVLVLLALSGLAVPVFAHGASIRYTMTTATVVEITAAFDSGEPMRGAQVLIFTPGDPAVPWQTGVCDDAGRFSFTPDPALPGTWEVQVRQAGHGSVVYIEVGTGSTATTAVPNRPQMLTGSNSYTPLQMVVMGGCVVWGLIGTALFFASRGRSA